MRLDDARVERAGCGHGPELGEVEPGADGCEDCLAMGHRDWVHLRICMTCGHVGCCDSSPGKHASAHYRSTSHPVVQSWEDAWAWCYADQVMI